MIYKKRVGGRGQLGIRGDIDFSLSAGVYLRVLLRERGGEVRSRKKRKKKFFLRFLGLSVLGLVSLSSGRAGGLSKGRGR